MGPAPTHTDHMVIAASSQDEGPDGERYRADTIDGVVHVGDLSPTLSTLDVPSTDRFEDSTAAVFTSTVAAASTTSGSLSSWLQVNASCDPTNNSERDSGESAVITGDSVAACWGHPGHACDRCCLNSKTPAQPDFRALTELVSCHTGCTRGQPGTEATALTRATNQTAHATLPQNSDCENELDNTEATGQADGNLSVMGSRQHKRKLSQSAVFPLHVTSVDISKQARVEESCSFNNLATCICPNQGEIQHQLFEDRLMQTQVRHGLMDDTVDKNVLSREKGAYHLHVDRRELEDEDAAETLVASAVSDTSPVCEGEHRAAGVAGGDSVQLETQSDLRVSLEGWCPQTQPDLWARMESLYKTTPGKRNIITGAASKRSVAEKFHLQYKRRHLADSLASNGCHLSNKRTRSQISRRASRKTRAVSIRTRSSQSWQIVDWCPAHHRYRVRSNSSSGGSSRSRSHSPIDSNRGQSWDSDNSCDYIDSNWSSQESCRCKQEARSLWRWHSCRSRALLISRRPGSPLSHKQAKNHHPDGLDIIKQLFAPLVLPPSVTTIIAAPVTGTTSTGKGHGSSGAINKPSVSNSVDNKHPSAATLSSPEKAQKVNGGQNSFPPNMGDKNKPESRGSNDASFEANTMSLPPRSQNMANSRVGGARMDAGNPEHYMGPPARSANHFGDHPDHNMQREEQRYEPHFNNMGYHPGMDHSFHEDAGYEFYGADYDYLYDERNDEYGFGNEPYPPHLHRHPGPNTYYPRRPPPQGPRGPPQMFAPNDRGYGPPRPNMGGPSSRMGPNGPVGSRGPRSPMGPRGHRPQGGPGGPLGPPVMRGPPRGSPYGPPRGSPYGPPGPMRPQGMRGPPGPGMMGQAGHGGPTGPRPRLGPPARMQSPMPRQGSQPPGGPRPRMGPPPSGPPPRDDQYLPQRPAVLPPNTGDPSFCNPLPNFSQPPPNFVPSTSSLPPSTATTAASAAQIADVVAPPPPLPPPKPPTPKPPPPPKKEEEKKEEIKPMTPLIPPEQAEQYRKLREQARKHARKQQRKQEHQAKGEPESSDDDDEEATAKKKEYEAKLSAEREEMEKAALLAVEDNGTLHFEEGATILMPATQQTLMQQPTMMVQHHPLATQPSSYGLVPASHLLHTAHPGLHPSQLQNLQFMTSAGQPQLVQLPNGQMAYAMAAPMSYQTGAQMVAMPHQAAMSAGAMPHHLLFSSGGMHQVPVTAHSGLTVSGSQYMAHVMASQVQAAQIQAAQAAQIQAAQAAQVQAAQAAQVQAVQAAQIQAAQVAQVQAVQAAQAQAVQAAQAQAAQVQSGMPGMMPGMHMAQHVLPAMHPQGQYILVPRVARPQM